MSNINYQAYIKSIGWKEKRASFLASDHSKCFICGAEKYKYSIWQCRHCGQKFYGDKYNFNPSCDCYFYFDNVDSEEMNYPEDLFIKLTDGSEYFQLHHLTYKNLGAEKDGDLVVLCCDCHRLAHCLIRLHSELKKDTVVNYLKDEKTYELLKI